jgi:dTDP-glucose 4,6-dehydratase
MKVLVTGGAGFIGSNFLVRFVPARTDWTFLNIDKLSYASNLANLSSVENADNYQFQVLDLKNEDATKEVVHTFQPDKVVHFAAESHVDRSISSPKEFIESNINGTFHLLQACREVDKKVHFHHVSTDEVYGSLGDDGFFTEESPYDPSSPYSASKAASDHLVRAYHRTYGMNVTISNCSNNYGPRQFPEKLIPLMILNCLHRKPLPVYGAGAQTRDWLHVDDHNDAILTILEQGRAGETYNIGGNAEQKNLDIVRTICRVMASETGCPQAELEKLITYVEDRAGHDWRYAIDASKIKNELGWTPKFNFEQGIRGTVRWYLDNPDWVKSVQSGQGAVL